MEEYVELTAEYVIGVNKSVQEVSTSANALRHPDRLRHIVQKINQMFKSNQDPLKILSYILHSFPVEQPFNNGNHRTAYIVFEKFCSYLGQTKLGNKIRGKEAEEFVRYVEFLTLEQIEDKLKSYLL